MKKFKKIFTFCLVFCILVVFIPFLISKIIKINTIVKLNYYNSVINYLENYKKENGIYPSNINPKMFDLTAFKYYDYKTFNENKEYILYVGNNKPEFKNKNWESDSLMEYKYCSDKTSKYCTQYSTNCDNLNGWLYCSVYYVKTNY